MFIDAGRIGETSLSKLLFSRREVTYTQKTGREVCSFGWPELNLVVNVAAVIGYSYLNRVKVISEVLQSLYDVRKKDVIVIIRSSRNKNHWLLFWSKYGTFRRQVSEKSRIQKEYPWKQSLTTNTWNQRHNAWELSGLHEA